MEFLEELFRHSFLTFEGVEILFVRGPGCSPNCVYRGVEFADSVNLPGVGLFVHHRDTFLLCR